MAVSTHRYFTSQYTSNSHVSRLKHNANTKEIVLLRTVLGGRGHRCSRKLIVLLKTSSRVFSIKLVDDVELTCVFLGRH